MGQICLTVPFRSVWSKAGNNHIHGPNTDDAASNQKEEVITESNSDPETTPLAVSNPTRLVEELEQTRLELGDAPEAYEEKIEDVTKTEGDKPDELSTKVPMTAGTHEGVFFLASRDLGASFPQGQSGSGGGGMSY